VKATRRGLGCTRSILLLALLGVAGTACAQEPRRGNGPEALRHLEREGKNASFTILPVGLAGQPSEPVAEAVGLLLERAGMPNLEIGNAPFVPPADAEVNPPATAEALSAFVRTNPLSTDYALYSEFRGSPDRGLQELRAVIVARSGEIVWQDRQTPQDADFKRMNPKEPLGCALLLVERLRPVLGLYDPNRADAPQGKLAERWSKKTGIPGDAERAGITQRQEAWKKAAPTARLVVFPVLLDDRTSSADATEVVTAIHAAGLTQAIAGAAQPKLEVKGAMNEQKMLWDLAHAFQEYVRKNPPDEEYALYAHYGLGNAGVGFVHVVVCDRRGDWVLVDFQNDHHKDFNQIAPKTAADCNRLVVKRLVGYLK
jgi:hypothetical protein